MHLLFISKSKIEVFKNDQKLYEVLWTQETLSQVFSTLKNKFSSCFRVLISDEFVTVSSLLINPKQSKKRSIIQSLIQPLTTDNLSQTVWDYKIITKQNNLYLIQAIIISKTFFDQLRSVLAANKIKVKLLQNFSTSLSQYLPKKELVLLIYQDLLVISLNQNPIFSKLVGKTLSQTEIDEAFSFCQKTLKINPQKIFFYPLGNFDFKKFDFHSITPESVNINPLQSLKHPKDLDISDAHSTRLEINHTNFVSRFPKILLIIPILILLTFVFLIFQDKILPHPKNNQINPIISITPTATPTPIDPKNFKIEILNGSGVAGQAAKVSEVLTPNGFVIEKTGNASNFNFTETQIQIKSTVPESIINLLTKSLDQYSAVVSDVKLESSDSFDIIITIGK